MANIKFSDFAVRTTVPTVDYIVGYQGADNIQIAPTDLLGDYLPLAGGTMTGLGSIHMPDNFSLNIGSAATGDAQLYHNGSKTELINFAGELRIINAQDDGDIVFRCDNGSGGTAEYFRLDGGTTKVIASKNFAFLDDVKAEFGDSGDLQIFHNATDSIVYNGTGALMLRGADIRMQASDGGETMAVFTDNGAVDLYYDNALRLDTTDDGVAIRKDNSGALGPVLLLDNTAGGNGDSSAIVFASGGNTYQRAQIKCTADLVAPYNGSIEFYTGRSDLGTLTEKMRIAYDGNVGIGNIAPDAKLEISDSANDNLRIGTRGGNINLFSVTDAGATAPLRLEASQFDFITGDATFAGNVSLPDSKYVYWGGSNDFYIGHAVTETNIINSTGNLNIEQHANDADIVFASDDGSGGTETYFYLDGGEVSANPHTVFPDNSRLSFGNLASGDFNIWYETGVAALYNNTGNLQIANTATDGDVRFYADNGSGGTTEYLRLDGGTQSIIVTASLGMYFNDGVAARFGDIGDLQIYHDGTHSYITNATGILNITNNDIRLKTSGDETMLRAVANGAVEIMYDHSTKLSTTATGTVTYGQMDISALNTAPASAGAAGVLGEIRYTADYIYVCTATNTWKRTAIATW